MIPNLDYLSFPRKLIEDKSDFYNSGIQEASKIRNLCNTCQRIFVTSSKNINLYLVGEKDIYQIDVLNNKKGLITTIYYLPKQMRLDLYDGESNAVPLFCWKSKQCIFKNISILLDTIKIEKLLNPLLSIL